MRALLNFALFQTGWLACVWGAARGSAWIGPLVVGVALALHLRWFAGRGEAVLVAWSAAAGLAADSALAASELVSYAAHSGPSWIAPLWIVAMWANFAITLRHSLAWLHGRLALAALLGGVFGPLAYLAGERLGALVLVEPTEAALALALIWAVALPGLSELSSRHRGGRHSATAE